MLFLDTQFEIEEVMKVRNGIKIHTHGFEPITFSADTMDDDCTYISIGDKFNEIFQDSCFIYLEEGKMKVRFDDEMEEKRVDTRKYRMIPLTREDAKTSSDKNRERALKYRRVISTEPLIFVPKNLTIEKKEECLENMSSTPIVIYDEHHLELGYIAVEKSAYVGYLIISYKDYNGRLVPSSPAIRRLPTREPYVPYICRNGKLVGPSAKRRSSTPAEVFKKPVPFSEFTKKEMEKEKQNPLQKEMEKAPFSEFVKKEMERVLIEEATNSMKTTKTEAHPKKEKIKAPVAKLNNNKPEWFEDFRVFATIEAPMMKMGTNGWNILRFVPLNGPVELTVFCNSLDGDFTTEESYELVLGRVNSFEVTHIPEKGIYRFTFHTKMGDVKYSTEITSQYLTYIGTNLIIDAKPYKNTNGEALIYAGVNQVKY